MANATDPSVAAAAGDPRHLLLNAVLRVLSRKVNGKVVVEPGDALQLTSTDRPESSVHGILAGVELAFQPGDAPAPKVQLEASDAEVARLASAPHFSISALRDGRLRLTGPADVTKELKASLPYALARSVFGPVTDEAKAKVAAIASRIDVSGGFPRFERPSEDVRRDLARRSQPAIFTGCMDHWEATSWTRELLAERYGDLKVKVRADDYARNIYTKDMKLEETTLRAYLAAYDRDERPPYLANNSLSDDAKDAIDRPPWPLHDMYSTSFWIGPAGTFTPLHCDWADNILAQVVGQKRLRIVSPHLAPHLHIRPITNVLDSCVPIPAPADLENLHAGLAHTEIVLGAGEMLFLPGGWFHEVKSLTFSVSVNFFDAGTIEAVAHGAL